MRHITLTAFLSMAYLLLVSCDGSGSNGETVEEDRPTVAFVTNGVASFWYVAEAGARQGEEDFDVNVIVKMPASGVVDQNRNVEELLARSVDGIAISPIDGKNQNEIINEAASRTNVITHDSDAPDSARLCYVGMDNYAAGRMCGELIRQAMPDGGEVMIFIGRLEQDNARHRRQGVIDELLDRDWDSSRYDDPGATLQGEIFTILGTRTDGFDHANAKAQAEDAIARYPGIDGMIGLFAYNPPAILEALATADKLGEITLIGFDEAPETLQAIVDGHCYGTIVQNPYMYGYESVRILAGLARDKQDVLPEGGFLNIPARTITAENVEPFWADLKEKLGEE